MKSVLSEYKSGDGFLLLQEAYLESQGIQLVFALLCAKHGAEEKELVLSAGEWFQNKLVPEINRVNISKQDSLVLKGKIGSMPVPGHSVDYGFLLVIGNHLFYQTPTLAENDEIGCEVYIIQKAFDKFIPFPQNTEGELHHAMVEPNVGILIRTGYKYSITTDICECLMKAASDEAVARAFKEIEDSLLQSAEDNENGIKKGFDEVFIKFISPSL